MKKGVNRAKWVIGIDEAGRGPLAGPVAVGACLYDPSESTLKKELLRLFPVVKDSKQLSFGKRESLYRELLSLSRRTTLRLSVALVSPLVIDRQGIVPAIQKGVGQALKSFLVNPRTVKVLLDGGLRAPEEFIFQRAYTKGDATYLPIAIASIIAKVTRDRHMIRLARRFPGYGFDIHKGYGTKGHYAVLRQRGRTNIHRQTFLKGEGT